MTTNLLQTPRPAGGFRLINADPPWRFTSYSGAASVYTQAEVQPYPTMSLDELKALPVGMMAARDAVLNMWIVDANLLEALEIARCWGFTFKSRGMTWDKGRMAGGFWFRKESEISLLFTRGSPSRLSAGVRDMIREKPREHSRKPDESYRRLERLCRGPRLDLFGRQQRAGWVTWSNEPDKFPGVAS